MLFALEVVAAIQVIYGGHAHLLWVLAVDEVQCGPLALFVIVKTCRIKCHVHQQGVVAAIGLFAHFGVAEECAYGVKYGLDVFIFYFFIA